MPCPNCEIVRFICLRENTRMATAGDGKHDAATAGFRGKWQRGGRTTLN